MARGKHSTALFEVIHSNGASKPGRIAQSLRTPKWWFKSRHSSPVTTPAPAPVFEEPEAPVSAPVERAPSMPSSRSSFSRDERSSGVQMGFDRGRQEVTLRLRYTTALVSGFAVCAVIGMSYVIGRHLGGGPKTAAAVEQPTVKQLQSEPPQPGVTSVAKPKPMQPRVQTPPAEPARHTALAANGAAPKQSVVASLVPPNADTSMPRKVGLYYLVINTYPGDRIANAEAARDFFTKNGVPCTIEKKTGWTMGSWVTLIGTAGFSRTKTDDYKNYVDRTAAVAKTYKSANFDHPEPSLSNTYRWRATDEPSN